MGRSGSMMHLDEAVQTLYRLPQTLEAKKPFVFP
jgi:hypothetical protein